jgi:hypothetical protein
MSIPIRVLYGPLRKVIVQVLDLMAAEMDS